MEENTKIDFSRLKQDLEESLADYKKAISILKRNNSKKDLNESITLLTKNKDDYVEILEEYKTLEITGTDN